MLAKSPESPIWILANHHDKAAAKSLADSLSLPPLIASLLHRRGLKSETDASDFLNPRLKSLTDPFLLPNMRTAIDRILAAIDRHERIALYGDYDVDGVSSLAIFCRILRAYGAAPDCFLPMRKEEGYGLSPEGVERCMSQHRPQLLIALDCGTSSADEISSLMANGVDVLVFDHHETKAAAPCCPLVNPKLGETFHDLCTAGIVFKAAHALLKTRPLANCDLKEYLDLAALGTVADLVPLLGENRILVKKGLAQMTKTRWPGLRALLAVAGVKNAPTASDIGFRLGPRLNAAGRLNTAEAALDLLLADSDSKARKIAAGLDAQNRERQTVERQTCVAAEKQLAEVFDPERDAAIVVGETGWHPGVVGIVASRISRSHHRPAFVIGFDENGIGKGSGRSIQGLSLVHALAECSEYLEKFGGHEMAAGLTMRRECFEDFRAEFCRFANDELTSEQLQRRLHLDCEIAISELSGPLPHAYEMLQPFGMQNAQPLLFTRGVTLAGEPRVLKEKHLLFELLQNSSRPVRHSAIYFNGAETELPPLPWDVAFRIEQNSYAGETGFQIQIVALRAASESGNRKEL